MALWLSFCVLLDSLQKELVCTSVTLITTIIWSVKVSYRHLPKAVLNTKPPHCGLDEFLEFNSIHPKRGDPTSKAVTLITMMIWSVQVSHRHLPKVELNTKTSTKPPTLCGRLVDFWFSTRFTSKRGDPTSAAVTLIMMMIWSVKVCHRHHSTEGRVEHQNLN